MGRLVPLTAQKINGQSLTANGARVVYVQEDAMLIDLPTKTGKLTKVTEKREGKITVFEVYEKAMHIEAARNPASTDVTVKQHIALALAGAGTTQGAGTALTRYYNEALTIGAAATEAFVLPAATVGKAIVIVADDAAGDAAKVFPASGEFINDQAVNTVLSIAAGDRVHFYCPTTAGKWRTAIDRGK